MKETEITKKKVGRPRKNEYTSRAYDDPNLKWTPEKGLAKMELKQKKAKTSELYPEPNLPKNFTLSATARKYFNTLYYHFEESGIDTQRYMLALIQLSKLYAHEEACEEELKRIGSAVAYKVNMGKSDNALFREHPAAKHLHQTRTLILSYLKALNLMPNSQDNSQRDELDKNPFAKIAMMKR